MDELELLVDLHRRQERQGPGGTDQTLKALDLSGLRGRKDLSIADIGCGAGASTLVLAQETGGPIIAVDLFEAFLQELEKRAEERGLSGAIQTQQVSMDALTFDEASLDLIWSEGAIYNIGFANGVRLWRRFLKPGGIIAVSEMTWLTDRRPPGINDHWRQEYSEIDTAAAKIKQLEESGYMLMGYFPLPKECWAENYYSPLEASFDNFSLRQSHSQAAQALITEQNQEIAFYERSSDYMSYGFYIAKKVGP